MLMWTAFGSCLFNKQSTGEIMLILHLIRYGSARPAETVDISLVEALCR